MSRSTKVKNTQLKAIHWQEINDLYNIPEATQWLDIVDDNTSIYWTIKGTGYEDMGLVQFATYEEAYASAKTISLRREAEDLNSESGQKRRIYANAEKLYAALEMLCESSDTNLVDVRTFARNLLHNLRLKVKT